MSGTVEDVVLDLFKGDEIILSHADGMKTIYRSVTGILVKEGDEVDQGQPLATATENEWNPTAGIHLHFEVQQDGVAVNPALILHFNSKFQQLFRANPEWLILWNKVGWPARLSESVF